MTISEIIATNLKRLRVERNMSLGQLAELAGVSKVILAQLEKGTSNPTINTVWKITGALHLPYTSLLDLPEREVIHVKKKDISDLEDDKYHLFSYYAKETKRPFELYQIEMDALCVHESIGHSSDSTEYIMLISGKLELEVNNEKYLLEPDDGFCFEAGVPHIYRNMSKEKIKAWLMIYYT